LPIFFFYSNEFLFVSGIIVLLSLQFFTPYFYYIPKASLAAVIIAAVVFMVEFHVVKPMWKTKSKLKATLVLFFKVSTYHITAQATNTKVSAQKLRILRYFSYNI